MPTILGYIIVAAFVALWLCWAVVCLLALRRDLRAIGDGVDEATRAWDETLPQPDEFAAQLDWIDALNETARQERETA